jgi:hypothetical protein
MAMPALPMMPIWSSDSQQNTETPAVGIRFNIRVLCSVHIQEAIPNVSLSMQSQGTARLISDESTSPVKPVKKKSRKASPTKSAAPKKKAQAKKTAEPVNFLAEDEEDDDDNNDDESDDDAGGKKTSMQCVFHVTFAIEICTMLDCAIAELGRYILPFIPCML